MRDFAVVIGFAAVIMPILAATVPVEARSQPPCREDQGDDQRCGSRDNRMEVCKKTDNGWFWEVQTNCASAEFCDMTFSATCVCKQLGYVPYPACMYGYKLVDGKYVAMDKDDVEKVKFEGAKVEDAKASHTSVEASQPANTGTTDSQDSEAQNIKSADHVKRLSIDNCTEAQEYDLRCRPSNSIVVDMCEYSVHFGRYVWLAIRYCQMSQYCDQPYPGVDPMCKDYGYVPQPVCVFGCKLVNGTHVPMNATEIAAIKPAAGQVDAN